MNIDLSNPPYAVKLNDLGFAYSHTDREKGIIVYTHAEPRLVGSPWISCWDDMECIIDFEDENCMKPFSFTFKNLRNGVSKNHSGKRSRPSGRSHPMTATISITDKGKTITYHAHHMRDVIEPVKQYGMFGEQLNAKKKLHTLTFYTED